MSVPINDGVDVLCPSLTELSCGFPSGFSAEPFNRPDAQSAPVARAHNVIRGVAMSMLRS